MYRSYVPFWSTNKYKKVKTPSEICFTDDEIDTSAAAVADARSVKADDDIGDDEENKHFM